MLAGEWRWHGAKSSSGPAEISPNVFGGTQDGFRIFVADANEENRDVGWAQGQGWEQVWNSMWIASAESQSVRHLTSQLSRAAA